mgnify:CR=1 FL=1
MTALYSLNHAWPQELPFRVRTPDGGSRTDPATFTPEELATWGYAGPFTAPQYDELTQVLEWSGTAFAVRAMTPEERAAVLDRQWALVRIERNRRLQECDWTQLPDSPADKQAWAAYRQQLRDVTLQPDPFAITWPVKPA